MRSVRPRLSEEDAPTQPTSTPTPQTQPTQPTPPPVKNAFQGSPLLWPNVIEFDVEKLHVNGSSVQPDTAGDLYMIYNANPRLRTPIIKMAGPLQVVSVGEISANGRFCNLTLCPHGGMFDRRSDGTELKLTRNEQRDQLQTFFGTMERNFMEDARGILGPVGSFYGVFDHSHRTSDFGWRLKVSMNMGEDNRRTRFKMRGEDGVYREARPFTNLASLIGQQVSLAVSFSKLRYKKEDDDDYTVSLQAYAAEVKILGPATEDVDASDDEAPASAGESDEEEPVDVNPF